MPFLLAVAPDQCMAIRTPAYYGSIAVIAAQPSDETHQALTYPSMSGWAPVGGKPEPSGPAVST